MKSIRIISVFLIILMLAATMVACANTPDDGAVETTTPTGEAADTTPVQGEIEETTPAETAPALQLPEGLSFNKDTFTIFTWSNQTQWEWDAEDYTGELLDDAIYDRKLETEERVGVTLNFIKEPGEWENRNNFINKLAASVMSGAKAYDLVSQYTPAAAIGAMQGLYLNLNDVEHLNNKSPWWAGDIAESSAINGNLYFTTGDITPTLIRNMGAIMANLDMAEAFELGDLYDIVDKGEWTLDKLEELSLGKVAEFNDGQQYYAFTFANNVVYDNLFYGAGFKYVDSNADGSLTMSDTIGGERIVDWFVKCQNFLNNNADVEIAAINQAFTEERAIFHLGSVADVQNYLKDVDFDFAILPAPKFDTAQENYATIVGYWVSMFSIPIDAANTAKSGATLEALGYYGMQDLTPAFYEEAFQYRYLSTEANARMFNLLHDTLVYDTGRTFADQIACFSTFRKAAEPSTNWTSLTKTSTKIWDRNLSNVYEKLG